MRPILADLLKLLELERIEDRIFRGESRDLGGARVFGGQVLGQALTAASYTVRDRQVHSLHAYFLVAGDVNAPIVYEVDVARDGKSFSNRRVVAIQHGQPIFNMTASFQVPEEGSSTRRRCRRCLGPKGSPTCASCRPTCSRRFPRRCGGSSRTSGRSSFGPSSRFTSSRRRARAPVRHIWVKTVDALPDNADLHRNVLAYVSDYQLVSTATLPHGIHFAEGNVQLASLDHAMWFHRPFRADEWLLYAMESPNASGGRGLALGKFFTRDGTLVASTAQEGVVRVWAGR